MHTPWERCHRFGLLKWLSYPRELTLRALIEAEPRDAFHSDHLLICGLAVEKNGDQSMGALSDMCIT
jgi:hypothetical protein